MTAGVSGVDHTANPFDTPVADGLLSRELCLFTFAILFIFIIFFLRH